MPFARYLTAIVLERRLIVVHHPSVLADRVLIIPVVFVAVFILAD